MRRVQGRGIILISLLIMVVLVSMLAIALLSRGRQSLRHSGHYRDRILAVEAARGGANHLVHLLSEDHGHTTDVEVDLRGSSYRVCFDPADPDRSVNNLPSSTVSTDLNFRGEPVPPFTGDIVVVGRAGMARARVRVVLHRGYTGHRSVAALGKVVVDGDCVVDGIKSLAQPDPAAGGIMSKHTSTGPGDYAIEWTGAGTFDMSALSLIETAPAESGGDSVSANLRTLFPDQIEDQAGADVVPDYDVAVMVASFSGAPAPLGMTFVGLTNYLATSFIDDDRYVSGDLVVNGDLVVSDGALYIQGDLTLNGGLKGLGSVYVDGAVTLNGGNTTIQTNQLTGAALFSSGDVTLQGLDAEGYLASLATMYPALGTDHTNFVNLLTGVKANADGPGDRKVRLGALWWQSNQLTRDYYGPATDYWVNPIPGPNGSHADGHPEGLIPSLTLNIKSEMGAAYSADPRAQKVVHALEEFHYFFRHNADYAPPDSAGYTINDQYKLDGVDLPTYLGTVRINDLVNFDDGFLPFANWSLDHQWYSVGGNPLGPQADVMLSQVKSFTDHHPLDFSWLGESFFQGIVYARGDISADNRVHVVGSLVSLGDVTLTGDSKLTFNEDYLEMVGADTPVGITFYEEL